MSTPRECTDCRHELDRVSFGGVATRRTAGDQRSTAVETEPHLATCSACREYADEIAWLAAETDAPLTVPSVEVEDRVRRAVFNAAPQAGFLTRAVPAWQAAAAAVLLFGVGLGAGTQWTETPRAPELSPPAKVLRLPHSPSRTTTKQASIERHDYAGRFLANREVSVRLDD